MLLKIPKRLTVLLAVVLAAGLAAHSLAQPPGRGGPGGMRGGPPGGGRFGGGPPGGGRFGGGPPGSGGPSSGVMSFIQRLDTNGNGMLDPEESQGRAGMFIGRIAEQARLDLSRPIPLSAVAKAFEQMRQQASMGGGRDPRSSGDSRSGDSRSGDSRSRGSSPSREPELEPLVPGFGEPILFDPVPGFGAAGERYAVAVTDEDRQEARQTLGRYDQNKDGIIDQKEMQSARWRSDPLATDRNHDGKLSLNELALRYAVRRADRAGDPGPSSSSSRSSSSGRSSSSPSSGRSSSSSGDDRQARMVQMIMARYDTNKNGILEKSEWKGFRTDPTPADTNRDGRITKDEMGKWMGSRFSAGRSSTGSSRGSSSRSAPSSGSSTSTAASSSANPWEGRNSYRRRSPTERLPEGLPDWFGRSDANADGQVMMHEYSSSWSESVGRDFAQFDLNGDGIATIAECLKAVEAGAVQGAAGTVVANTPSTPAATPATTAATPGSRSTTPVASSSTTSGSTTGATRAKSSGTIDPRYIKYAVGMIQRYDKNRDGVLVKEEWSAMKQDYGPADTDGDGRLTPVELAAAFMNR